jgi:Tol biopolymer transport system component
VFRSERDGGGLYVIPSTGGSAQLLVQGGLDPRFSPDGRWVAYWSGDPLSTEGASVWVIPSSGGKPGRIHPEFLDARHPVWSADGRYLLFVGHAEGPRQSGDWYVVPFENGASAGRVIRTGAETLLRMQTVRETSEAYYSGAAVIPSAWVSGQVVFSARLMPMGRQSGGLPHLLRIPISPSILEAGGAAHEITTGSDWDGHPSVSAGGCVVFSRRESRPEIWSIAPDGSGEPRRLTADTGDARPSISLDGRRLAYRFHLAGDRGEYRVLDLETGRQIARLAQNSPRDWPIFLSSTGDELVYSSGGIFRVRLPDGKTERIARRGGEQAASCSPDGKRVLVQRGWRGLGLLEIETGHEREFLRGDRFPIVEARFSPDGKWVAYTLAARPHPQIFVVAVEAPEQPIEVTPDTSSAVSPAWSADGNQLYFLTPCQGFRCIWARRLEPQRKKPLGEPFPVRHFHHARYGLTSGIDPQNVGLVAARDKLVFGMFETVGNVWSLPSLPRP